VLDGDPAPPEGGTAAPSFQPMSIVTKRSPISATAEHLYSMQQLQTAVTVPYEDHDDYTHNSVKYSTNLNTNIMSTSATQGSHKQ